MFVIISGNATPRVHSTHETYADARSELAAMAGDGYITSARTLEELAAQIPGLMVPAADEAARHLDDAPGYADAPDGETFARSFPVLDLIGVELDAPRRALLAYHVLVYLGGAARVEFADPDPWALAGVLFEAFAEAEGAPYPYGVQPYVARPVTVRAWGRWPSLLAWSGGGTARLMGPWLAGDRVAATFQWVELQRAVDRVEVGGYVAACPVETTLGDVWINGADLVEFVAAVARAL